jgi:ribosome-associated protein
MPAVTARIDAVVSGRDIAIAAARAASAKQAEDILVLDVGEIIFITGYFVICSASSDRQLKTVIEEIEKAVKALGERPLRREGEAEAGWWLLDFVDVVVHVFGREERDYYELERLWSDAPRVEWEEPGQVSSG